MSDIENVARQARLIAAQQAYIEYLGEAISQSAGFLYAHNWQHDKAFLEKGNALRTEIKIYSTVNAPQA